MIIKKVFLPFNESLGGGEYYELIRFAPTIDHPEQENCFLLKPVQEKPNLKKMTKQELINYIEAKL